jgi:hypothetical protein
MAARLVSDPPRLVAYCHAEDEQRVRRQFDDQFDELQTSWLASRGKVIIVDEAAIGAITDPIADLTR